MTMMKFTIILNGWFRRVVLNDWYHYGHSHVIGSVLLRLSWNIYEHIYSICEKPQHQKTPVIPGHYCWSILTDSGFLKS